MIKNIKISVTSNSFSNNKFLTDKLSEQFEFTKFKNSKDELAGSQLVEYLSDSDGVIVGLEQITPSIIDQLPNLKIISKYGVGLDNLDLEYLKKKNIPVGWTGGVNRTSVSELTLCQMINLSRNIHLTSNFLKNGEWVKDGGRELNELTIGIIGVGYIGQDLIKKLKPFECRILANDIVDRSDFYKLYNVESASKEEIFSSCDILTIHTPKTPHTTNLISKDVISMMKSNAIIICTARGGIVNEDDLYNALKNNNIKAAALDVYEIEPSVKNKLHQLKNFIGTPHISGNSKQAVENMGLEAIKHIVNFFSK